MVTDELKWKRTTEPSGPEGWATIEYRSECGTWLIEREMFYSKWTLVNTYATYGGTEYRLLRDAKQAAEDYYK